MISIGWLWDREPRSLIITTVSDYVSINRSKAYDFHAPLIRIQWGNQFCYTHVKKMSLNLYRNRFEFVHYSNANWSLLYERLLNIACDMPSTASFGIVEWHIQNLSSQSHCVRDERENKVFFDRV